MKRTLKRCRLLSLLLLCTAALAACGQDTAPDPALLEPPGLRWNTSVDDTLDTLGITEVTFDEETSDTMGGSNRAIRASGVSFWGETADVTLNFTKNGPNTDRPGLCGVRIDFPDTADMQDILAQLVEMYGEGSQSQADDYVIGPDGATVNLIPRSETAAGIGKYADQVFSLAPSEHKINWTAGGKSLLTKATVTGAVNYMAENRYVTPEAVDELLDKKPLVQLYWRDALVLVDGTLEPRNQVVFNGWNLVYFTQIAG